MNAIISSTLLVVIYTVHATVLIENEDNQDIKIYDANDISNIFKDFIKMYNKNYEDDTEYNHHLKIFTDNLNNLNKVNTESEENTLQINQFADVEQLHSGSMYW